MNQHIVLVQLMTRSK